MSLVAESITKYYGKQIILSDIFISCEQGEVVGLLGRNGSGKSTLLKIIFGSVSAEHKIIRIDNLHIRHQWNNKNLIKYLPQDNFLPKNLKLTAIIDLMCTSENKIIIQNEDCIKPLLKKKSKEMSEGERRLAEILLILYSDTKYVLLDEPFNGIAPIYKEKIKTIIKEQSKEKGIIITDQDYKSIMNITSKIILLHEGNTKLIKTEDELFRWEYLK